MFVPRSVLKAISRCEVIHKERFQKEGCCIYIPNHTSLLDAVMLASHLPSNVVFVANTGIARKYAWAMKGREILSVDPLNPYSVRSMLKVLKAGKPMVIFPEGRITITNSLMKVYPGVAYLALKAKVPLVPIGIDGAEKAKKFTYLEGKIPTHWFPKTKMYIGEAFHLPEMEELTMREKKAHGSHLIYRELQKAVLACRMEGSDHLAELLRQRVKEAPNMVIAEDPTGNIIFKPLKGRLMSVLKTMVPAHVAKDPTISRIQLVREVIKGKPDWWRTLRNLKVALFEKPPAGKETMSGLWKKVVAISTLFNKYTKGEERLGIMMPTSIMGMVVMFAALRSGKTPALLNFSMDANTFCSCLKTGDIRVVVTSRALIEKGGKPMQALIEAASQQVRILYLEDLKGDMNIFFKFGVLRKQNDQVNTAAKDILLFTSGSESIPKGVLLTHHNVFANIQQARLMVDFTSQDKVVNALPMFHSFGMILLFLSPLCHVPTYLIPSPLMTKVIPELTYDRKGTILFGTPTFLSAYGRNAHPFDFARLRYVFAGAEKLQDTVRNQWFDKFGIRILEGYGLTETSPILALQTPMLYKKGTVGCLVPGVKAKLEPVEGVDEGGRLLVQAPNVMRGYELAEQGYTPAPEWFDTGDIVSMDKEGFITILGRAKRFVKIGGEMVSLSAVEGYALEAVGEGEVVAVRMTDAKKGERIELVASSSKATKELIREYWKQHSISGLLLPSVIHVQEIPKLGSGKADVSLLTRQIEQLYEKVS